MEKHSGGWRDIASAKLGGETLLEKKRCLGLNVPHISDQNFFLPRWMSDKMRGYVT